MTCKLINVCQYETNKLVRIKSVRLGSLKWTLNGVILLFISIMMLWNKEYQQYDFVVSSVTTKVKGVALTSLPGVGNIIWDVVDYSGLSQGKNSFFVMTNVVITNDQKQGKCPEVPPYGELCRTDKDCEKGLSDQHSHGVQTGACVKFDVTRKTCEVFAWCPIETKPKPPRPALLASAENFTVLIKNDIRFPAFNYIRRNILPWMDSTYLKGCRFNKYRDRLCPIFRLGDIIQEAKENFSQMAIEGGVIGIQINWDCNLDGFSQNCLPKYTFRRLDEKESNRTLYPGLNFRFARYHRENGLEVRTLYKAFGIRFDVMVFGKAGKFNIIQLIIYIGSTLSYYALTTIIIDWLIGTSCYSREARQDYSEKKVESVRDRQQCILCVSFVDDDHIRVVKRSQKKSLQDVKPISIHQSQEDEIHLRAMVGTLQCGPSLVKPPQQEPPRPGCPSWCLCGYCGSSSLPAEQLCCRRTRGRCITTSPLFEQLVLGEALLEAVLLYREPLCERGPEDKTTALRHCAYRQYITWRYVCYIQKGYQDTDSVISSVTTKVKGYAFTNSSDFGPHIWDVADFVIPPQGENSFFVLTNAIITQRQTQSSCPEIPTASTICIDDCDCTEGFSDPRGSGIQTGLCVNYSDTIKTCEVLSWCPLELDVNPPEQALLGTAENFTVLIKNSVTYPKFNIHRRNIMSDIVNASYLKRCEFSRKTDPHCPIFRLKTMVSEAEEDFQTMAVKGGVLGILIDWTCDLDWWGKPCHPQYTFRRLDNKNPVNNVAPGYNFRFAKYFNNSDGNETRTLIKGYGIRFDVIVFGNAGKFSIVPTIVNLGAALSFLSLTGAVCDWVLLTCTKRRHYYQKHKTTVLDDSDDAISESLSMGTTYGTH